MDFYEAHKAMTEARGISCECGNGSNILLGGYFPSDLNGDEVDPFGGQWEGLFSCPDCESVWSLSKEMENA
jgi:hypothetical protein